MDHEEERERVRNDIEVMRKTVLPVQDIDNSIGCYNLTHIHIAQLYYYLKDYKKAFYHLSESHGNLVRRHAIFEELRAKGQNGPTRLDWEYLSTKSDLAKQEDVGLFKMIAEMPQEWTIVQLSTIPGDDHVIREKEAPVLKEIMLSRVQCGPEPDEILVTYSNLPNFELDILNAIEAAKKDLLIKGFHEKLRKKRRAASETLSDIIKNLDQDIFYYWKCLFLGKLVDSTLQESVRSYVNSIFKKYNVVLDPKIKAFFYLMAEGINFFERNLVRLSIKKNITGSKEDLKNICEAMMEITNRFPALITAKRHSVILIVEDHLDRVPWENMPTMKDQAVTRVPSVRILYAQFQLHKKRIVNGLREIDEGDLNFYVINPDQDLVSSEMRLKPFFEARLPQWKGFVGQKPAEQMKTLLASSNTYIYCGHGCGSGLINMSSVLELDLRNSLQFLFGCSSAALNSYGINPMMGALLNFCIAGSPCSVGMLYPIFSDDCDSMTVMLVNILFPGTPIDQQTLKPADVKKELELLRAMPRVRASVKLASNGLAFIARGLPIKLVLKENT